MWGIPVLCVAFFTCAFVWFKGLHSLYLHREINIYFCIFKDYTNWIKQFQDTQLRPLLYTVGTWLYDGTLSYSVFSQQLFACYIWVLVDWFKNLKTIYLIVSNVSRTCSAVSFIEDVFGPCCTISCISWCYLTEFLKIMCVYK